MENEIKLYGSKEIKEKVLGTIRKTIGELVTDEELAEIIQKAKKDFLDELYNESKLTLKSVYSKNIKAQLEKEFIGLDYDSEVMRMINSGLKKIVSSVGLTPISLQIEASAKATINHFIRELNRINYQNGINEQINEIY